MIDKIIAGLPIREGGASIGRNYYSGYAKGNNDCLDGVLAVLEAMR